MSKAAFLCCTCAAGSITLGILLILSFSSIEVNEIALDYSGFSKSVGKDVYTPGIHFLGVTHSFIKYPSTVLTIDFSSEREANAPSVKSRTSDGLEVDIEISFQYLIQSNKLYDLYMKYADNYQIPFEKIALDVLTDIATRHNADNFFFEKEKISFEM
jgi:hypothetical protein